MFELTFVNLHVTRTHAHLTEPQDYVVPNGTIVFPSWSDSGGGAWCTPVYITNDQLVENSKQFTLQLVSTNPAVIVDDNSSSTTIEIANNRKYITTGFMQK